MTYDLLLKGGEVVDPAQGIHSSLDIGVDQGRIAALAPDIPAGDTGEVMDIRGLIVTPGLIDIHTHVAEAIIPLAVAPDEAGVLSGVTTVCDAGSTGRANLDGFRKFVMPQARTDIFCFLHLSPVGEANLPEIGWQHINPEEMLEIIDVNREIVKGIKIRATVNLIESLGMGAVETAKRIAAAAGLPIVVHLGIDRGETIADDALNAFTQEMLSLLEAGDVLTHIFTNKPGGLIKSDGSIMSGLLEAMKRGVVLDVASAIGHLDFQVARKAIELGLLPTTLSTDFTASLLDAPVPFSLLVLMSEFLALGLDLDKVVELATINPAKVLNEEQRRGSLRVGMPADITLFELIEGDFLFVDSREGNRLSGERLLVPKWTLKCGVKIAAGPRARSYAHWSQETRQLLTQRGEKIT